MVRHLALLPAGDLVDDVELRAPHFLIGIQDPVRGADERLLEVDGIVDDRDDHQVVAMPDEPLGHRRPVAVRDAVALEPAGLQMRGEDRRARRRPIAPVEKPAHVCAACAGGCGRPSSQISARGLAERAEQLVADRLLRDRIELSA